MGKIGRPKGTNNKEVMCSLRMDESTKARLEQYCRKRNIARSTALRQAIEKLIEEE